jgi:quinoprotein glucose dehydrogenase
LIGLKARTDEDDVSVLLVQGHGVMPPNLVPDPTYQKALLDFLFRRNQPPSRAGGGGPGASERPRFIFDGYNFLTDQDGFPGNKPPWGLLNCYDLNTGKILWRVPLGEIEALVQSGRPKTGAQNLGGATVTAGGLVFVAGTADQKLRAFDANNGDELWSAKLPFAGTAAPAVYEIDGREYVVITATGGGKVGGPVGDAYVAFALPTTQ